MFMSGSFNCDSIFRLGIFLSLCLTDIYKALDIEPVSWGAGCIFFLFASLYFIAR